MLRLRCGGSSENDGPDIVVPHRPYQNRSDSQVIVHGLIIHMYGATTFALKAFDVQSYRVAVPALDSVALPCVDIHRSHIGVDSEVFEKARSPSSGAMRRAQHRRYCRRISQMDAAIAGVMRFG